MFSVRQTVLQFFKKHSFPLVILLGILLLRFGPLLLGKVFFFGDDFYLMVPGKIFTVEWMKKGIVPLWNPYVLGGISWIGDINQSIWYGSTLLFAFFPPALAVSLNQAFHVVIGFMGAFLLGRRWGLRQTSSTLLAVFWTMGMNVTGGLNNISILQSLVWIPWVMESILLLAERVRLVHIIRLSLSIAFFIFAGYPQFLVYAGIGGIALAIWKFELWKGVQQKRLLHFFSAGFVSSVVALLLTAIAILPFLETLRTSTRMIQSEKQSTMGSVQPIELFKIILPSVFDNFSEGMRWGPVQSADPNLILYVGWMSLILIMFRLVASPNKKDVFFACSIGATLLFSMGSNLPGYDFIQKILPVFRYSRGPGSIFLLTTLFIGIWLGTIMQEGRLLTKRFIRRLFLLFFLMVILSLISLTAVQYFFTDVWNVIDQLLKGKLSASPFHTVVIDEVIGRIVLTQVFVSVICALLSCWLIAQKKIRWFVVVVLFDVWFATKMLYVYAPASVYDFQPNEQLVSTVQDAQTRVLTSNYNVPYADFGTYYTSIAARSPFTDSYVDRAELQTFSVAKRMQNTLTPDWGNIAKVRSLHGYVTLMPQSANSYWNRADDPAINNLSYVSIPDPRLKEWSVGYYLVDTWFPNVGTISATPVLLGDKARGEDWALYKLNALPRFRFEDGLAVPFSEFIEDPNRISFRTTVPSMKKQIIVADRWEPGWTVLVDGKKISLSATGSGLRTFSISPGDHFIEMRYSPSAFWIGAILSLTSWVGVLLALIFSFFRDGISKK